MALNLKRSKDILAEQLKELHSQSLYLMGQYVFSGSGTGKSFELMHLPGWEHIGRIVMLFGCPPFGKTVLLEVAGNHVHVTESDHAAFLTEAFLSMGKNIPVLDPREDCLEDAACTVRIRYPQPVFLPLLWEYRLIHPGYSVGALGYADREASHCAQERSELLARFSDMLREYFDIRTEEEWESYMDTDYRYSAPVSELRDLVKYLEAFQLIDADRKTWQALGSKYTSARYQSWQDTQALMTKARALISDISMEHRLQSPMGLPAIDLAMWHLSREFPEDLPYGHLEQLYAALGAELTRCRQHRPNPGSDAHRLWQNHWDNLQCQLSQIQLQLEHTMRHAQVRWEGYLA